MDGIKDPTAVELKAEIDMLREEQKELVTSFPGAVRTLIVDMQAWRANKREFPKSAVIGVLLAYMRPRYLVFIGSILAAALATAQAFMLWQQNKLIAQQNE